MNKGKITVTVDTNMTKLKLRLRTIAKHAEALANELDEIDNMFVCECGSTDFTTVLEDNRPYKKVCDACGEQYVPDENN